VPAVVYAQPLEIYVGSTLSMSDIGAELDRLGYQQQAQLNVPGMYKRTGTRLEIHLRGFQFMERLRASQRITVSFADGRVGAMTDPSGRPVPLIRLDPLNIGSFFPSHGEDRIVLSPNQVPELLTESLKAVEDADFDRHWGFSLRGILRAAWVNLGAGEIRQGGSTLTQQLVKSYFLHNRQTYTRKLREVAMAIILELRYSKRDLLNAYVNEIYLGQDGIRAVHGFGLGSQFYFNKPLSELAVHELATLIAIIRGPSYYNPYRHPERTHARRDLVLDKMHAASLIDATSRDQAAAKPFQVIVGARSGGAYYPAFMDKVRAELNDLYAEQALTSEGLRVFTTLSPRSQDAVESQPTSCRQENFRAQSSSPIRRPAKSKRWPAAATPGSMVSTEQSTPPARLAHCSSRSFIWRRLSEAIASPAKSRMLLLLWKCAVREAGHQKISMAKSMAPYHWFVHSAIP
jgi:penicillin-binding protein 1B